MPPHRLFFPAAAIFAAGAVPLWTLQYAGIPVMPGAPPAYWHGHEMVFGYALAVVAGYLLTRLSKALLGLAFGLWLAARLAWLLPVLPRTALAAVALGFPICLFLLAGPAFLRAAKRWRNAMFGVLLGGVALAELIHQLGALGLLARGEERGLVLGVDLLALLLFAMGGRIIAAATSGALRQQGIHLPGLAQPRLERLGVVGLFAMAVLDGADAWPPAAALLAALVAGVALVRLAGWHAWRVRHVAEVAVLHLGYVWLVLGLSVKAVAQALDSPGLFEALHGLTVGALGALTVAMMARVSLQRARRPITVPRPVGLAIALIAIAALARLGAIWPPLRLGLLEVAALAWSLAYLALLGFMLPLFRGSGGR